MGRMISELSKRLKAVNRYEMDEKVLIGFNIAVEIFNECFGEICALKNEQTDGDLISRQAVLDIFGDIHPLDYNAIAYVTQIKELPSAEKTAEWVNNKCSICDKGIEDLIDSREWYENEKPNYCPFCGAKMKESGEG